LLVRIMSIVQNAYVMIKNTPEAIRDYASDPANWSASNPEEHFALTIYSQDGRPRTGAQFHQKETVAGRYADLRGHFLHVVPQKIAVWRGIATYRSLGLIKIRIPEGGVMQLQQTGDGTKVSHDVYMDFSDPFLGSFLIWYFKRVLQGEKAVYDHTYKELGFLQKASGAITRQLLKVARLGSVPEGPNMMRKKVSVVDVEETPYRVVHQRHTPNRQITVCLRVTSGVSGRIRLARITRPPQAHDHGL
jgi:hypothetical protein